MSLNKGSPGHESSSSSAMLTGDDSITRDFSLVSLVSAGSTGSQDEFFSSLDHPQITLKRMQACLENRELCDVILVSGVDDKKVSAHRLVLAASSSYFAAMFNSTLRESTQEEIILHNVQGDALELLVNYCYSGTVELREDNVETLLATASLFQMSPVVSGCANFLARQLHYTNCLGFSLFAEQQACTTLLKLATSYTCENFMTVCKSQEFFQLNETQVAALLKQDELNVPGEEEVFHALISWVQHDKKSRMTHVPKLLPCIKLPLIKPAFLADNVEQLCVTSDCQQLILEAMKWHLMPDRRTQYSTERTKPRKSTVGKLLAIGGMDSHKGCITIESYCPRLDKWTLLKNMPTRRLQFGVVLIDDKLIIIGGRDGLKTLSSVETLDLAKMTYTTWPSMGTPRHGLGTAVLDGPIYACGGHDGWSYLNTVERFDPANKTWSYVAPMSTMRSTAGVAVLGNKLYAVGGRDGSVCHRTVECYDPHVNRWTMRAPMHKRRGGVAVAALNGFLYAFGGHDCPASNPAVNRTETVERYDSATDTWSLIASLSFGRDAIGCSILGNSLVVIGGYNGNEYLKVVEEYSPETNSFKELSSVNYSRAGSCVVAIPNNLEECAFNSSNSNSTTV